MSEHRVLLIEHQAYLSIDLGRLCIRRPQQENEFVLPADIAMLCLHHPAITVTAHTLQTLSKEGAIVLVTDDQHLPLAQVYPPACPHASDTATAPTVRAVRVTVARHRLATPSASSPAGRSRRSVQLGQEGHAFPRATGRQSATGRQRPMRRPRRPPLLETPAA